MAKRKPQLSRENITALKADIVKRGDIGGGKLIEEATGIKPPIIEKPPRNLPEYFSPSAKARTAGGGFMDPRPDQIRGTSPEIELQKEREKLLETELPERAELDPERISIEKVPIIGNIASSLISVKRVTDKLGLSKAIGVNVISKFLGDLGGEEISPRQLRTLQLTAIERAEIERGLTANEAFGAFVEGVPIIGTLVAKYAAGLETPTGNAAEVVNNIRKERKRIANIETNVKLGYLPITAAQEQVKDIELNIQKLESRLRLLINNSPTLKFNSDGVNTIETEILSAREKIFQAKNNILTGKLNDPDELNLYLKTQELGGDIEEFDRKNLF